MELEHVKYAGLDCIAVFGLPVPGRDGDIWMAHRDLVGDVRAFIPSKDADDWQEVVIYEGTDDEERALWLAADDTSLVGSVHGEIVARLAA